MSRTAATERIYLDSAATTRLLPEAFEAMRPWLGPSYGNAGSLHAEGRAAREAVDLARERISEAMGCLFGEVLFTSGGTEAANLAILGVALACAGSKRNRVLLGAAEHLCVLATRPMLERLGLRVELIPVNREAAVNVSELELMLSDDVLLVSVMHSNNELGTINDLATIAEASHAVGALVHSDAVQTFETAVSGDARGDLAHRLGVDLITVSAHKTYGPKGVGAVYARSGVKLAPLVAGGGQEREVRGGTENVAGIVGFGAAVDAGRSDPERLNRARLARDAFLQELQRVADGPFARSVTSPERCAPGHAHLRFPGVGAESMLILLDRMGVSASSGAACSSGSLEPSHVLAACGYSPQESNEGLRFTFGKDVSPEQAREAANRVAAAASRVSRVS